MSSMRRCVAIFCSNINRGLSRNSSRRAIRLSLKVCSSSAPRFLKLLMSSSEYGIEFEIAGFFMYIHLPTEEAGKKQGWSWVGGGQGIAELFLFPYGEGRGVLFDYSCWYMYYFHFLSLLLLPWCRCPCP